MTVRKAKLGKKIEKDIIRVLKRAETPISTRDISIQINRAWHSVQNHCLKLQLKGEVDGFNISNLNVWKIKRGEK